MLAPLALIQLALPRCRIVVNVTSDAAVEPYEGWGGYGSSKAALEQLTAILAAEHPDRRVYAVDPGDMNTRMHQEAFPGEDISDRSAARGARPRPARPDRGRPAERPLQRRRAAGGARVSALAFSLTPPTRRARRPPSATRSRLLVAQRGRPLVHDMFRGLPAHLRAGDLLVVNTSATMPAALPAAARSTARRCDAAPLGAAARAPPSPRWVVELRRCGARYRGAPAGRAARRCRAAPRAELLAPVPLARPAVDRRARPPAAAARLPRAARPRRSPTPTSPSRAPLEDLQTIFADEPGSAEMPSAGRPFSQRVLDGLLARGVQVAPLVLHTGVSSLERGERPYPERYRVPALTASRVNAHRAAGGRVIAIGTTVVRALETVAGADGTRRARRGLDRPRSITPERGVRAVDGLLTGWHEPDASHLLMLEAVGGRELIERSYAAALAAGYRWHEFGDTHLILR